MITANLDFDRVAQGRKANQLYRCADQKSHFQKASAMFRGDVDFRDGSRATRLKRTQRLSIGGHRLLRACLGGNRLNENAFGQLCADAEPGIADLANDIGLATHQLYLLFFTEAHFTQAMRNFRGGGKLLDANGRASDHAAERAKERLFGAAIFA